MRYLIILLLALASCKTPLKPLNPVVIHDTVYVPKPVNVECDTLQYTHKIDSMYNRIDKYSKALLLERTRIEAVKKYVRIVDKNPSQIKFLKGWVKRAISE